MKLEVKLLTNPVHLAIKANLDNRLENISHLVRTRITNIKNNYPDNADVFKPVNSGEFLLGNFYVNNIPHDNGMMVTLTFITYGKFKERSSSYSLTTSHLLMSPNTDLEIIRNAYLFYNCYFKQLVDYKLKALPQSLFFIPYENFGLLVSY